MAIHLGPRARKAVRYAGIAFVAVLVFLFALQMTFPYGRVKDKAVEMLAEKYDITIGSVERGWIPGRVYFKAVMLRTRPTKPDETITTMYIESLEVDVGFVALIGHRLSIDLEAKLGGGKLAGNLSLPGFGKDGIALHFDGHDLPGGSLPMRMLLGLPMTGKIDLSIALDLPNETNKSGRVAANWQKADGNITFECPSGCTIGDGKTKLKPLLKNRSQQGMVGDGIDFGKVTIDRLLAKVVITPKDGGKPAKLEVTKFDATSKDGELHVDYAMALEPVLDDSVVTGCLRFKGSDSLLKREPKTYAAIQTTGAELRADGLFHITLSDKLRDMKRLNLECGPNAKPAPTPGEPLGGPGAHPMRPNLTIQPDEPRPPPAAITPPPAPPPPVEAPRTIEAPRAVPMTKVVPPEPEGSAGSAPPSGGDNPSAPPAPPGGSGTAGAAGAGEPSR